tara:strand:+ start:4919 stop:5635 length:717 start_codon:yes stop_codon:yes gene_type:complete
MKKTALLIQPGAFGDIIVCAPIAEWYASQGYEVLFPARKKYHSLLKQLPYVTPILLDDEELHHDWLQGDVFKVFKLGLKPDITINLADRGPHPLAQRFGEYNAHTKYRLANVPFEQQHKLSWTRRKDKEDEIYNEYVPHGVEYAFVHNSSSDGEMLNLPPISLPIIFNDTPEGYSIFDWYKLIINASEVYCSESALHCFCDGIIHQMKGKKYLLPREAGGGELLTKSEFWDKKYFYEN